MASIRIQKLISRYGYTSRRKAELLIEEGRVRINGIVVRELGIKVPEKALIEVDGNIINRDIPMVYLILHKPRGFLCSKSDPLGRRIIYDLIEKKYKELGIFNVGRLDYMSEGLIIMTNDGYLANKINHPSYSIIKKYEVTTDRNIPYNLVAGWKNGVYIEGKKYTIVNFEKITLKKIVIYINEGKNREIRRLFNHINIGIIKLKRIAIGCLKLDNLPPGEYRELTEEEVKGLIC